MKKIVKEDLPIERFSLPKDKAIELMKNEPYKVELINDLPEGEEISFYKQGDFTDLCRGPHVETVKLLKNFKLLNVSGAYWRGDSNRNQLQRVYGTCFFDEASLKEYLVILEERKKREAEEEAARKAREAEIERENREYEQVKSQLAARENANAADTSDVAEDAPVQKPRLLRAHRQRSARTRRPAQARLRLFR